MSIIQGRIGRKLVVDYIKSNWAIYIAAVLIMATAHGTHALFPEVLGRFTDELHLGELSKRDVMNYSLILLAIGVVYGVLFGGGQFLNHRSGRMFEMLTRQRLFQHFSRLSEAYFAKNGIGKLLSYVMNDVTTVRELIANGINQMTSAIILLSVAVAMMAINGVPVSFILLCMLPMLAIPFLVRYFGPRIRGRSAKVQESLAKMTESAEEQFGGIRVTKTFAIEPVAERRFGETVDRILDNQLRLVKSASLFQALLPFAGALSFVVAITYGGYLTAQQQITLGDFVAVTLYLRMIVNPLQQIGNVINTMQRARASIDRLNDLLAVEPDIREEEAAAALERQDAEVEIRGLTFAYPDTDREVLRDISLRVEPGKTIGLVGKTGSGKTTLVKLLLRIYDPPRGKVFIGGKDIRDLTLQSLRTQVAYVPQDGFLFSTTLRDNIAFSDRGMKDAKVEEAARLAVIYNSIDELPERFETVLGERGLTLSGGQRQRTSLARGLVKKAPILILDDSVSAVDTITETSIVDNMSRERKGKTTILIAHRVSALKFADEIVVLSEGRIIERGTHEELLAAGGYYASLCAIQEEAGEYE